MSDEHVGEVVTATQIFGANEYNLEIAEERYKRLTTKFLELSFSYAPGMKRVKYPGCVVVFAGDGVSGNIHEELVITNERPVMECVRLLRDWRIRMLRALSEEFGSVYVVGVVGNHGRTTKKIPAKDPVHTSFDWMAMADVRDFLLGSQIRKRFRFLLPDSIDARFRVFGTRYVVSHGYEQRGGDGIIGPLGPITRGDVRRRARDAELSRNYDVSLGGHFHQYLPGQRRIFNGSMIGYNEFAYRERFAPEPPMQAAWFSHPVLGVTYHWPIFLDTKQIRREEASWVSWVDGQDVA